MENYNYRYFNNAKTMGEYYESKKKQGFEISVKRLREDLYEVKSRQKSILENKIEGTEKIVDIKKQKDFVWC